MIVILKIKQKFSGNFYILLLIDKSSLEKLDVISFIVLFKRVFNDKTPSVIKSHHVVFRKLEQKKSRRNSGKSRANYGT